jgi:hypothetical protein
MEIIRLGSEPSLIIFKQTPAKQLVILKAVVFSIKSGSRTYSDHKDQVHFTYYSICPSLLIFDQNLSGAVRGFGSFGSRSRGSFILLNRHIFVTFPWYCLHKEMRKTLQLIT